MSTNFEFIDIKRIDPDTKPLEVRKANFGEIYEPQTHDDIAAQSSRCLDCGNPYCEWKCPVHNYIPDWLKRVNEGNIMEAADLCHSTNSLPEVCGRVCPQDRLCEGNCVIEQSGHGSVTIGSVEKYLTDNAFENGWITPLKVEKSIEKENSIGVIGAGPAGLAAAEELRKKGYKVHVYDRYDRAGGLLIYGIPNFKLEKDIVQRRMQYLKDSGINIHLNVEIGKDIKFEDLQKKHDAVLIATGVYKAKEINLGESTSNIIPALEYLTASNRKGLGDEVKKFDEGELDAKGKDIVVIGGGDTAMDCVRTAVRQKAKSVKCLYRRDKENMPGSAREVNNAEEEGVEFMWQSLPINMNVLKNGYQIECVKMRLSEPDADGRRTPQQIDGSDFNLKADMVIAALGFSPENLPTLFNVKDLPVTKWGTVRVGFNTMMTDIDGVFAAGDIVRGASLVVWGIRDGRDVANSIHSYIEAKKLAEVSKVRAS